MSASSRPTASMKRGETVGGGLKTCVQPGNPLRLAHIEEIDGIDVRVVGKEADIPPPVPGRANQAVKQQQRPPGASALVVDLGAVHQGKSLFDPEISFCHSSANSLGMRRNYQAGKRS